MSSQMAMWTAFGLAGIGLMAWCRHWRKTSEDPGPTQAPPGYLLVEGVHCLYPPKDVTQNYEFEFDIVFIHGLQVTDTAGFWWKTWTVIGDDGECWPATWIKDIFPKARVLALEYNSSARGKRPSTMWNQANDAVNTLINNPVNLGTRPFFLVGHSMGGLLAKELLLKASRPPHDGTLLKLCKGVVFYGVPHLGSDLANWGKFLNDLFCGGPRATDFIKEDLLSLGKATVQRNTEFNGLPRIKTYDFIENWDTEIAPGVQLKVVSEASAAPFADATTRCIIEANHYDVCRPARKESRVFTNFVNFVKEALDADKCVPMLDSEDGFVGLKEQVARVKRLMRMEESAGEVVAVSVCGVHGMGGIGKTTTVQAVFDDKDVADHFGRMRCFLKVGMGGSHGEVEQTKCKLQKKLLKDLAGVDWQVEDSDEGRRQIRKRFQKSNKKVLVVLDDVWDINDAPFKLSDLGHRSCVLITSRNTDVLTLAGAQENVVLLDILSDDLSLQLLCLVAFGEETPPKELEHLVKEAQKHCGGLPLALNTVGNRAKSDSPKTVECWQKIVDDLNQPRWNEKNVGTDNGRQSPHYTLRSSVEAAPQDARTCFILIGAFLLGRVFERRRELAVWLSVAVHDGKRQNCINSLNELEKRALISCHGDRLVMHDLFVDIAREFVDIAREEACEVSSLFFFYREPRGTNQLTSPAHMLLEGPQDKPLRVPENLWSLISLTTTSTSAWEEHMSEFGSNLRAVRAVGLSAEETSVADFKKLKLLNLGGVQSRALKGLETLSVLELLSLNRCESLKGLEGLGALTALQVLNLSGCKSLTGLESLGAMPSLQWLDLKGCKSLTGLEGLGAKPALEKLNLSVCKSLTGLEGLGAMPALRELLLSGCKSLKVFKGPGTMPSHLSQCYSLMGLGCLGVMPALEWLDLSGCKSLTALEGLGAMPALLGLLLIGCKSLTGLERLGTMPALYKLDLSGCKSLTGLEGLGAMPALEWLDLIGCKTLTGLEGLGAMPALHKLDLSGCKSLTGLEGLGAMPALQALNLSGCKSLTGLEGLEDMPVLAWLDLSGCKSLTGLEGLGTKPVLQELRLIGCNSLTGLEGLGAMPALETLNLSGCKSLTGLEGLGAMPPLQVLNLNGCKSLTGLEGLGAMSLLHEIDMRLCSALVTLPAYPAQTRALFPDQFMKEGGGIPNLLPALIALLKSDSQVEQEAAVRTVRHMARRCKKDMIAIGGDSEMFQALVERMVPPAEPPVQLAALLAVFELGQVCTNANAIADRNNIIAHITRLLSENPELYVAAPDVFKLLPQLEAHAVPQFLPEYVECLKCGEWYDQVGVAISLKDTARSSSSHRMAVGGHEGVLPALLKLISPDVNPYAQRTAVLAFWELQKDDEIRATVEGTEYNQEYLKHLLGPGFPFSTPRPICSTEFQGVRHMTVKCDGCGMLPVEGICYISLTRDDYNLCSSCFLQRAEDAEAYVVLTGSFEGAFYLPPDTDGGSSKEEDESGVGEDCETDSTEYTDACSSQEDCKEGSDFGSDWHDEDTEGSISMDEDEYSA